jgi:hypothetical protein
VPRVGCQHLLIQLLLLQLLDLRHLQLVLLLAQPAETGLGGTPLSYCYISYCYNSYILLIILYYFYIHPIESLRCGCDDMASGCGPSCSMMH